MPVLSVVILSLIMVVRTEPCPLQQGPEALNRVCMDNPVYEELLVIHGFVFHFYSVVEVAFVCHEY